MSACVFCDIIAGTSPGTVVELWPDVRAIVPLFPVVDGHIILLPNVHVDDFTDDPVITGAVARRAAQYAGERGGDWNLIASKGPAATATIGHLHIHLVPRHAGDGLALPWSHQ